MIDSDKVLSFSWPDLPRSRQWESGMSRSIVAGLLALLLVQVAHAQSAESESDKRRALEIVAAAARAGGMAKVAPLTHECYYHDIFCGQTVSDTVNIYGCRTDSFGYFNAHRLLNVANGAHIQTGMRSDAYQTLIILTDANANLLTYRKSVPGQFSNDVTWDSKYAGTYYILAGPSENLVTGPYLLYATCEGAHNPPPSGCAIDAPSIIVPPQARTITAGATATLTVIASGAAPLIYEWWDEDAKQVPSGGNTATWTTPTLLRSNTYSVKVTNSCGSVISAKATVTVTAPARQRAVRH
jgi:hypothetical protein